MGVIMSECKHEFTTAVSTIKVDVEKCDNCGFEFVESVHEADVLRKENEQLKLQVSEQEKYAELGRLALNAMKNDELFGGCPEEYGLVNDGNRCKNNGMRSVKCTWQSFCQKRAELLAEVQK